MSLTRLFDTWDRDPFTLLGVGPMSPMVVQAALQCAAEHAAPMVFIPSRNQVEAGGGYVAGWTPAALRAYVSHQMGERRHAGPVYIGRDHGGPWQRDADYQAGLGWEAALAAAMDSYAADLAAGFDYLHIDTAKDPAHPGGVPLELALDRAVTVLAAVEAHRVATAAPPVAYEVSLEQADGGCSTAADFGFFMDALIKRIDQRGLPTPLFMVGNTGTLTTTGQAGTVDFPAVRELAEVTARHGVVLKEHNADYLTPDDLARHPGAGIGMANVAPEFGRLETEALILLSALEQDACRRRGLASAEFGAVLERQVLASDRWRKWAGSGDSRAEIVASSGHYFYGNAQVTAARGALMAACARLGICAEPEAFVREAVKAGLRRYLFAFRLAGRNEELCDA